MQDIQTDDTESKGAGSEISPTPVPQTESLPNTSFAETIAKEEKDLRNQNDSEKNRLEQSIAGIRVILKKEKGKGQETDAAIAGSEIRLQEIILKSEARAKDIEQDLQTLSAAGREASEAIKRMHAGFESEVAEFSELIKLLKETDRK